MIKCNVLRVRVSYFQIFLPAPSVEPVEEITEVDDTEEKSWKEVLRATWKGQIQM